MESKKHILLLTTGGTIACRPGEEGLEPQDAGIMQRQIAQMRTYYDITVQDVMCLDSSNIRPEEWQKIARHIFEQKDHFDGIVVSHGTDTMPYTASAVTFMLPGIDKPVVFTGSQLPLEDTLSDAPDNLRTAFAMAAAGHPGVFVAFDRKVMLGCRAVKVRASDFSAFESVNARYAGQVSHRGLVVDTDLLPSGRGVPQLKDEISKGIRMGISALTLLTTFPLEKSAPLDFCAEMILSVSSISVGTKRSASDIIMAKVCTGKPILARGESSRSIPSVRSMGEVV